MNIEKFIVNGQKTINYLKKNGLVPAYYAAKERLEQQREDNYQYVVPSATELEQQRSRATEIYETIQQKISENTKEHNPTFSALIPAYETKREYLFALLDSLRLQSYPYWELVLVDANKSNVVECSVKEYINQYPDFAKKLCFVDLLENKGISENTNAGLCYCKGEYICLVDHDDMLTPDAFYCMAETITYHLSHDTLPAMIYSDEDKCNSDGTVFYDYNDKYDFDLDLILSNNYICHLTAIRNDIFQKLGERAAYDGAQDFDLVLRVISELIGDFGGSFVPGMAEYLQSQILHVPRVLYHWRCHKESTAQNTESKRYAYEAGLRAVRDFLNRHKLQASVEHSLHLGFYKVEYQPDIFAVRSDVAVVGGRILDGRKKMLPCIMNGEDEYLYVGLHKRYSGRMHRFSLLQAVAVADLRNTRIADFAKPILSEVLGKDCDRWVCNTEFNAEKYVEDMRVLSGNHDMKVDWEIMSQEFCQNVRLAGYTILYDPCMEKICNMQVDKVGGRCIRRRL